MDDALVIVSDRHRLAEVEAAAVLQRYGERVLVVAADAVPRLRTLAGVAVFPSGVSGAAPPPEASETERAGVDAWNARAEMVGKQRPGEGLPWDTPGFEGP